MNRDLEVQRDITRIALERTGGSEGFALAGSGAIREHGLIDRPTQDVDLFTTRSHVDRVDNAAGRVAGVLRDAGYTVTVDRMGPEFARLHVVSTDGYSTEVDFGIDWRKDDPVALEVGPVLTLADAVASKTTAVYSRAEARDFLDLDGIRVTGSFRDTDLLEAAAQRDPGFDREMFADQLELARRVTIEEVQDYGVGADQLAAIKGRLTDWAETIRTPSTHNSPHSGQGVGSVTASQRAKDSLTALNKLTDQQETLHRAEQKSGPTEITSQDAARSEDRSSGRSL